MSRKRLSLKPINTSGGGQLARCIKAGYFKMGWTNFTREILDRKDGFAATAILEVYEDCRSI
jgi:hypothetical protein